MCFFYTHCKCLDSNSNVSLEEQRGQYDITATIYTLSYKLSLFYIRLRINTQYIAYFALFLLNSFLNLLLRRFLLRNPDHKSMRRLSCANRGCCKQSNIIFNTTQQQKIKKERSHTILKVEMQPSFLRFKEKLGVHGDKQKELCKDGMLVCVFKTSTHDMISKLKLFLFVLLTLSH